MKGMIIMNDLDLEKKIRIVEDFPKKGISFKDVTPIVQDPQYFKYACDRMTKIATEFNPTLIVGPEARGFVFGTVIAYNLNKGFVMARKDGKLPGKVINYKYTLEYGVSSINIPADSIKKGDKIVLVDDLLATGGTLQALVNLIEGQGAKVVGIVTLIELTEVRNTSLLKDVPVKSLIKYPY